MSSATSQATLSRNTSACSDVISLSTTWAAVILWPSAIVVLSFIDLPEQTDDSRRPVADPLPGPAPSRSYTTSSDSTKDPQASDERWVHLGSPAKALQA